MYLYKQPYIETIISLVITMPLESESQINSSARTHMEPDRGSADWNIFGFKAPKSEIVFATQVILLYIVVITSIVNLSILNGESTLWTALLSSCIGYLLPNPTLRP